MLHAIGLRGSPICTTGPTANGRCIFTLQWNNRVAGPFQPASLLAISVAGAPVLTSLQRVLLLSFLKFMINSRSVV